MNKKGFELDPMLMVVAGVMWIVVMVLFVAVFSVTKQKLFGGLPMFLAIAGMMIPISYGMAYAFFGRG